jgi:hypothetical protein
MGYVHSLVNPKNLIRVVEDRGHEGDRLTLADSQGKPKRTMLGFSNGFSRSGRTVYGTKKEARSGR